MTLTTTQMIILGSIGVAIIIVIAIIVANTKKSILKKEIDDLNIRFNTIKTIPIAFKLNKAQAMAKRIEDTSEKIQSYYNRYTETQKHKGRPSEGQMEIQNGNESYDYQSHNGQELIPGNGCDVQIV